MGYADWLKPCGPRARRRRPRLRPPKSWHMAPRAWSFFACLVSLLARSRAAPWMGYADMRVHMSHMFQERAHEMSATLVVLQDLSKATLDRIETVQSKCGPLAG